MSVMLSVAQAAGQLGVAKSTITSLIKRGELRASDISLCPGGRPTWRIPADEIDLLLSRRANELASNRPRKRKSLNVKKYF